MQDISLYDKNTHTYAVLCFWCPHITCHFWYYVDSNIPRTVLDTKTSQDNKHKDKE